jgi:hypothetical protein
MVVVDLVNGRNAYHDFRYGNVPQTVLDDVRHALAQLHGVHLVHGYMRRSNIMVAPWCSGATCPRIRVARRAVVKQKFRDEHGHGEKKGEGEWHGLLVDLIGAYQRGEILPADAEH